MRLEPWAAGEFALAAVGAVLDAWATLAESRLGWLLAAAVATVALTAAVWLPLVRPPAEHTRHAAPKAAPASPAH